MCGLIRRGDYKRVCVQDDERGCEQQARASEEYTRECVLKTGRWSDIVSLEGVFQYLVCRHFFHAIGRKKRKRKKKKREKKRKKKGEEKGREKRETLFQASSNSSSRAAKVTDVFRSRCDKKGHFGLQTLLNCFNKINILLAVALKPSIQHLWDLVLFDSSD